MIFIRTQSVQCLKIIYNNYPFFNSEHPKMSTHRFDLVDWVTVYILLGNCLMPQLYKLYCLNFREMLKSLSSISER